MKNNKNTFILRECWDKLWNVYVKTTHPYWWAWNSSEEPCIDIRNLKLIVIQTALLLKSAENTEEISGIWRSLAVTWSPVKAPPSYYGWENSTSVNNKLNKKNRWNEGTGNVARKERILRNNCRLCFEYSLKEKRNLLTFQLRRNRDYLYQRKMDKTSKKHMFTTL